MKISHEDIKYIFALHYYGYSVPKLARKYGITERGLRYRFAKIRLSGRDQEYRFAATNRFIKVLMT